MCVFSFEDGMAAESWYAEFALRIRVRKSAIGSVIVMSGGASLTAVPQALGLGDLPRGPLGDQVKDLVPLSPRTLGLSLWTRPSGLGYQELLLTPGSSPAWAISRRQMRHRPNLRKTACGRPQRWQRV